MNPDGGEQPVPGWLGDGGGLSHLEGRILVRGIGVSVGVPDGGALRRNRAAENARECPTVVHLCWLVCLRRGITWRLRFQDSQRDLILRVQIQLCPQPVL